jgi:hypothetical protein
MRGERPVSLSNMKPIESRQASQSRAFAVQDDLEISEGIVKLVWAIPPLLIYAV